MRGKELAIVVLFVVASVSGQAGNLALLRGATVTTASTPGASTAVRLIPVTPATDVYLLVLSDSLTFEDLPRLRHDISVAFTPSFLGAHALHLVNVLGTGTEVSGRLATSRN